MNEFYDSKLIVYYSFSSKIYGSIPRNEKRHSQQVNNKKLLLIFIIIKPHAVRAEHKIAIT